MEQYILISKAFQGVIIITQEGDDLKADFSKADVKVGRQQFVLGKMAEGIDTMMKYFNRPNSGSKLEKMIIDFEQFWDRYDDKINSSKKKAKAKWEKMPVDERTKAFYFIGKYFASIPAGTRKKYAETYLNAELWNN